MNQHAIISCVVYIVALFAHLKRAIQLIVNPQILDFVTATSIILVYLIFTFTK